MSERLGLYLPAGFQREKVGYLKLLHQVASAYGIEDLCQGIDHFALKAADKNDYQQYLKSLDAHAAKISYREMHSRNIAAVTFTRPINFNGLGETDLLELMEPKPEKVGKSLVGFDHIEIFQPDLERVRTILSRQNVPFTNEDNGFHSWVEIALQPEKQAFSPQVKFTAQRLGELVAQEIAAGEGIVLK